VIQKSRRAFTCSVRACRTPKPKPFNPKKDKPLGKVLEFDKRTMKELKT